MSTKEAMIEFIRSLPDDVTRKQLAEEITIRVEMEEILDQMPLGPMITHEEFISTIDESIRQLDRGEGIPHEEVVRRMEKWRT